jgi:photosystem I subunit PsaN
MAAMNSSVLACSYAISGAELNAKLISVPSAASPGVSGIKLPLIKAQQVRIPEAKESRASDGRRNALALLAATLFTTAVSASNSSANAGVIDEYLEKSKANKVLFLNLSSLVRSYFFFFYQFYPIIRKSAIFKLM